MPLPPAPARVLAHRRVIDVVGCRRPDGLWEIEAHLTDTKGQVYANPWRGQVPPGEPIHDMWIRVTIDDGFTIRDIAVASDRNPYPSCRDVVPNFERLKGLTIGPGWQAKLKERVGGADGCTHLRDLLAPLAAVAFQTILQDRYDRGEFDRRPRPGLIDSCYAYRRAGEVIRHLWPNETAEHDAGPR